MWYLLEYLSTKRRWEMILSVPLKQASSCMIFSYPKALECSNNIAYISAPEVHGMGLIQDRP